MVESIDRTASNNGLYLDDLSTDLREIENSYLYNLYSASMGAIILLIGLLVEIIGATLLAGNHLTYRIKQIYSLLIKADLGDLSTVSVIKEEVMKFHGYLGSLLLIIGFILQMVGTVFVIGVSITLKIILIIASCIISFLILFYLMGQTPEQNRKEKIKVILDNLKRLIIFPIVDRTIFWNNIRCDYCLKRTSDGIVSYLDQDNSENHPFLHSPQLFHYSHAECTSLIEDYNEYYSREQDFVSRISRIELKKYTVKEYIDKIYPRLSEFYKLQKEDRKKSGGQYNSKPTYSEIEALKMFERVKKLKN